MNFKAKIEQLRAEITRHGRLYYNQQPEISDADYDVKFKELGDLERRFPEYDDPNSPTARVGSQVESDFSQGRHNHKMLSLDNTYSAEEVATFFDQDDKLKVVVAGEPKFDGCSLALHYRGGQLVQAITRGDGSVGEDVTRSARTIRSIPLVLHQPIDLEVRGEVVMQFSVFAALNAELEKQGEDLFANPRNAASGTLKQKDSRVVAKRNLTFIAYSLISGHVHRTHGDAIYSLREIGFVTPMNVPAVNGHKIEALFLVEADAMSIGHVIERFSELRDNFDFPIDGVVFKINDIQLQTELGDGTRAPKWATAYKYPPERKITQLLDIEVSVGRHGTITPVAILAPVQLSGVTVTRASLCNQNEVDRLGIAIGDDVYVERSADVIPKLMGIAKKNTVQTWHLPEQCPCCNTRLLRAQGMVAYKCPNHYCKDQIRQRLEHACSRSALYIDGVGPVFIAMLIHQGVTDLLGLMTVEVDETSAAKRKFVKERKKAFQAPLWRKLYALGIEGVGKSKCQDLVSRWKSLGEIVDNFEEAETVVLGEVHAASVADFLQENVSLIEGLEKAGFHFEEDKQNIGPLSGKTFVITGTLMSGKRDDVIRKIEAAGGRVSSSVTKKVQYLVCGIEGGANKAAAAQKLGTTVISEERLYALLGEEMTLVNNSLGEGGGL